VVRIVTTVIQNVKNSCVTLKDGQETGHVYSVFRRLVFAAQYQYLEPLMSPGGVAGLSALLLQVVKVCERLESVP
jgi:hypothetical protein